MTDKEIIKSLELFEILVCDTNAQRETICSALDLINRQQAEIDKLKEIAKKMHTWIFLNSYDEEKAYAECGLTDEENIMLGYGGKIVFEKEEIAGDVK